MSVTPQPLSHEMIISALKARDFAHFIDDDGDIGGNWQGCLIYFFRLGKEEEVLPGQDVDADGLQHRRRAPALCLLQRLEPRPALAEGVRAHRRRRRVRVVGEVVGDWERGVTPEQLDQVMICGIATGCELADAVAELSPDEAGPRA